MRAECSADLHDAAARAIFNAELRKRGERWAIEADDASKWMGDSLKMLIPVVGIGAIVLGVSVT